MNIAEKYLVSATREVLKKLNRSRDVPTLGRAQVIIRTAADFLQAALDDYKHKKSQEERK